MADGLNRVTLLGNLGADPELRMTPSGQSVMSLRVATTESYLDRNKVRQERTEWTRCSCWGKRGEALSKILSKGDKVLIEGRLQTSTYEKNGEKRYSTDVVVNNVVLCGGRKDGAGGSRQPAKLESTGEDPWSGVGETGGANDPLPF